MSTLAGKRILVVEDEFLIAALLEDALKEFGASVVGPAYRMRDGVALAESEPIDAAVLDVNLNGQRSDPIAAALNARNIPFVLSTGYGDEANYARGMPVLNKPYDPEDLAAALVLVMEPKG